MVYDGDIVRIVQFASLSSGQRVSTKFYLQAQLSVPAFETATMDAIELWLTGVYDELNAFCSNSVDLENAIASTISWRGGAWRIDKDLGAAYPTNPFWTGKPDSADQITALVTYSTTTPRNRRTLYQWGPRQDRILGNHLAPAQLARLVLFSLEALVPVSVPPAGVLAPVLVHALRDGAELLTGFTVQDLVSAMTRRRPAG